MARRVFFSFHYDQDILRVGQIRKSGIVLAPGDTSAGFVDKASWESVKKAGNDAIQRWIDDQLTNTSVTVVLIGSQTADSPGSITKSLRVLNEGMDCLGFTFTMSRT